MKLVLIAHQAPEKIHVKVNEVQQKSEIPKLYAEVLSSMQPQEASTGSERCFGPAVAGADDRGRLLHQ